MTDEMAQVEAAADTPEEKLLPEELLEKRLVQEVLNFLDDVPSMVGPGANAPLPKFDRNEMPKKDAAAAPKPAAAPAAKPAAAPATAPAAK